MNASEAVPSLILIRYTETPFAALISFFDQSQMISTQHMTVISPTHCTINLRAVPQSHKRSKEGLAQTVIITKFT